MGLGIRRETPIVSAWPVPLGFAMAALRPDGPRRGRQAFALHVPRPPPAATASSFTYAQRPPGHDGARLAGWQRSKLRSTGAINHRRSPSNGPPITGRRRAELARLRTFRTTAYSEAPGGGALWS